MRYVRNFLLTNLAIAGLFVAENVNRWWSHPGNWSKSRVSEELMKELHADDVALAPDGRGGYTGEAVVDGRAAFQVTVQQDAATYSMTWSAVPPQGRQRDGSRSGGGPGTMTKDSWLFVLYVNVALVAMMSGWRVAAGFSNRKHRNLVGYLGIPLFLVVLFFGSAFSESRLGDDISWQQSTIKWFGICVLFFAVGLFGRHLGGTGIGRHRSFSQRESESNPPD